MKCNLRKTTDGKMKWIVPVTLAILLMAGCGAKRGMCRHESVYSAMVFGESHPVRIAVGKTKTNGYHSQAQYYNGKGWKWLSRSGRAVAEGAQDWYFTPETYVTINEFFTEYWMRRFKEIANQDERKDR